MLFVRLSGECSAIESYKCEITGGYGCDNRMNRFISVAGPTINPLHFAMMMGTAGALFVNFFNTWFCAQLKSGRNIRRIEYYVKNIRVFCLD
jgi:hypothetical protein